MNTSRRQAEAFRWRWSLTGVEGVSEESIPPVWGVGMAGLLQQLQEAQGTGFYMVNWGCKVTCHATCALIATSYQQGCMNTLPGWASGLHKSTSTTVKQHACSDSIRPMMGTGCWGLPLVPCPHTACTRQNRVLRCAAATAPSAAVLLCFCCNCRTSFPMGALTTCPSCHAACLVCAWELW
jgi:hypothetical protein